MSSTLPEPLPLEVGQLGNFEARMARSFRMALDDWDEVCSALGAWESKNLIGDQNRAFLEQHRAWVIQLLGWGRVLQRVIEHPPLSEREAADRVNARLRHLLDKLALWHKDMSATKEDHILQAAFG